MPDLFGSFASDGSLKIFETGLGSRFSILAVRALICRSNFYSNADVVADKWALKATFVIPYLVFVETNLVSES